MDVDLGNTLCRNSQRQLLKRTWMQGNFDSHDDTLTAKPRSNKICKYAGDKLCFDARLSNFHHGSKNDELNSASSPRGMPFSWQPSYDPPSHGPAFQEDTFKRTPSQIHSSPISLNNFFSQQHILSNKDVPVQITGPHVISVSNGIPASYEQMYVPPNQLNPKSSTQEEGTTGSRCPECAAGKAGHIGHIGKGQQMDTS